MGLLGAIIIALIMSTPLRSQRISRQSIAPLLQNLLASNPQVLKMIASKPLQSPSNTGYCPYGIEQTIATAGPGQYALENQMAYVQRAPVVDMPYPVVQTQVKQPYKVQGYQNYPVAQAVPVKETCQVQTQYPVTKNVQTVSQTYTAPGCPAPKPYVSPASMVNPFLPAASPISALFPPTSGLLPPANPTFSRCSFLRKVPIPPPFL